MADADELNWDDLRYFLRAAQTGTLAGAARALGVDHSTMGRRLTALERSLGMPLVLRGPDGLRLTPLGESLVPLVEQAQRAVQAVHAQATQQRLRVRLAMPTRVHATVHRESGAVAHSPSAAVAGTADRLASGGPQQG